MCINFFCPGYDFLNTNTNGLEMNIWYNSTYNNNTAYVPISLLRVPRLVNAVGLYYTQLHVSDIHLYATTNTCYLTYRHQMSTLNFSKEVEWKCFCNMLKRCPK
jgi:hypothetical protein